MSVTGVLNQFHYNEPGDGGRVDQAREPGQCRGMAPLDIDEDVCIHEFHRHPRLPDALLGLTSQRPGVFRRVSYVRPRTDQPFALPIAHEFRTAPGLWNGNASRQNAHRVFRQWELKPRSPCRKFAFQVGRQLKDKTHRPFLRSLGS
jgi:hypothetical protein